MKVKNHRLCRDDGTEYPFVSTPNQGGAIEPKYLVMHFTAGRSAKSAIDWLTNSASSASAHLVIGRDGSVTQLVPFNRVAWHAGKSHWEGINGLNSHSIGIELDNAGKLTKHGSKWRAWFGVEYDSSQVIEAAHKHGGGVCGWHAYPAKQLEAALAAAVLLVKHYKLKDVIGHDDIAPGRKTDPGPAFPMSNFRGRAMGRADEGEEVWEAIAALNIRSGSGTEHAKLEGSPLPIGTRVEILKENGVWRFVDVLNEVEGQQDLQGWVHGRYLKLMA